MIMLVGMLSFVRITQGIRFEIDREECVSHNVECEGDTLHCSFVVVKADNPWHYSDEGVELTVTGPSDERVRDFDRRSTATFEFVAYKKGLYKFCFTNKSPYHETPDFDIHVAHYAYHDQHAKDEHINPILDQIAKLEEALYDIHFQQHWFDAQTERQSIVNKTMSRRAIYKAMLGSFFLITASFLQIHLLKRLFDRKQGLSRV
ncbi:transmembrane emp24 domain-containing protein p24beta2 [Citrus sinensis]|nr:transmembrane emp24 domain-containing protein p24beta2 [Citrus sinensis]